MFGKGRLSFQKVAGYYLLILFVLLGVQFTSYEHLEEFLKSNWVNSSVFILAVVGLFYVSTISKLKDILLLRLFDTEKYNQIYNDYMSTAQENTDKVNKELYLNKYGPLNNFVDMVRACGWTMVLIYPLFIALKYIGSGLFLDIISLLILVVSFLALWVSTYFIYANLKVLHRFNK